LESSFRDWNSRKRRKLKVFGAEKEYVKRKSVNLVMDLLVVIDEIENMVNVLLVSTV